MAWAVLISALLALLVLLSTVAADRPADAMPAATAPAQEVMAPRWPMCNACP